MLDSKSPDPSALSPLPTHVSFIIPVRDDACSLNQCLSSLRALKLNGFSIEIIVGDNGSKDSSRAVAESYGAKVVDLPGLTVAQIRNRAALLASGQLLAFVDADHILDHGWLMAAVAAISEPRAAAAGAPCRTPAKATWVQSAFDRLRMHPKMRCDTIWLGSGNVVVRREVFIDIGGFDESLVTCEDVDLCQKIHKAGWRILAEPRMINTHLGDPKTLRALFFGELWRGQDNMKVTLRGSLTIRAFASLLIPFANLLFIIIALAVLGFLPFRPDLWMILPIAMTGFVFLSFIRAIRMTLRVGNVVSILENFIVASVYESARSLALVLRATHEVRTSNR